MMDIRLIACAGSDKVQRERMRKVRYKMKLQIQERFCVCLTFPYEVSDMVVRNKRPLIFTYRQVATGNLAVEMCLTEKVKRWILKPSEILLV